MIPHYEEISAGDARPARSDKPGEALDPAALAEIEELSKATGRNVFHELADTFLSIFRRG